MAYEQTWDAENRLAAVRAFDDTTTYVYDGEGQLAKRTAYENLAVSAAASSDTTLNHPGAVTNEDQYPDSGSGSSGEFAWTASGLHWVQVDLGAVYSVDMVKVWHYFVDGRTYHNTKTQVSSDGVNWTTVFDSAASGEYVETAAGKTHTFPAQNVRYVRDWLNGNTVNGNNHWVEIKVYGTRTTVYVGQHYEKEMTGGQVTRYYFFGGQRVAMNKAGVVYYLLGDHLGSTALTVDASGNKASELRYKPYGEMRYSGLPGGTPTQYRFTGQRFDTYLNLYHMGARFYDPALSRWLSPDTLVPEAENPQPLNRYSYVLGNPLKYIDPTGHKEEGECPPDDPDCYKGDPLYELYTMLGLEDSMEYDTFRDGMIVLAEIYGTLEDFPLAGIRIEGTFVGLAGLDANLDIIWDWGNFDGDVRLTLGWQVGADIGYSGNAGLLFVGGMDNLDDYEEIKDHAGVTIGDDAFLNVLSVEGDYGWSAPEQNGERVQNLFIGFLGAGEEVGVWRGGHIGSLSGRDLAESICHFFEKLLR